MTTPMTHEGADEQLQQARQLADQIHGRLVEAGQTVAVAESLTGGLVSAFLSAAPATSVTFRGGLVVYSPEAKRDIAGVDSAALKAHGSVHELIAQQLATGARDRLHADYGIGLTGVAGPGTQDGRPVGEVYTAIADMDGVQAERHEFDGNRDAIRLAAVGAGLSQLLNRLDAHNSHDPEAG